MCISCGHLQAAHIVSQFAEHSTRLQRRRPTTLYVVTRSVWQQLHGKVILCTKDISFCSTLLPEFLYVVHTAISVCNRLLHYKIMVLMIGRVIWLNCRLIWVWLDTSPLSVHLACTGYASYSALGAHWTENQRPHLFTLSCCHALIIVTLSWRVRRKRRWTGYNECLMPLPV